MKILSRTYGIALLGTATVCWTPIVCAQTSTGSVVGRILDSRRASIPNARVTLRSVAQGFEQVTSSNAAGIYALNVVPSGRFSLRAEASGFSTAELYVDVPVANSVRADLILAIPMVRQTIQVVGEEGVSVQTQNAGLGQTITALELSALPSLTRTPYDFIALVPGANLSNDQAAVGFAVNGGRTQSANFLLDGGENNDAFVTAPAQDVPLDAIEEFRVQTNHFSAEYGRNSGFIANVVTKAGTAELHGSAYDFVRNSALAANTFGNNARELPRPEFNRNQFGGTIGGPLAREKLFFFLSAEPIFVRSRGSNLFYVPTPLLLERSAPGTQAIFARFPVPENLSGTDVLTRSICPFGLDCSAGSGFVEIPAFARVSRVGPQDAGAGVPQDTILTAERADWILDPKTQTFFRHAYEYKNEFPAVLQPYSNSLDLPAIGKNQSFVVHLIRTWSPRIATESHLAYARIFGDPDRFTGINPTVPTPSIPSFYILNEPSVTLPSGSSSFGGPQNTYQFSHTATVVRGNQTLRFGGQLVHLRDNRRFGIGQIGDAQFASTQRFVDGILASYRIAIDPDGKFPGERIDPPFQAPSFTRHYRYNEPSLFFEDTWRITSRFTVTPGLRWEYFGVFHSPGSEYPLDANFYPGSGNDYLEQIANGRVLRTVDAPGDLRDHFYRPDYTNFAPRLGGAYDVFGNGKTVFRSGVGVFNDRKVGFELFRAFQNPPNYSVTTLKDVPIKPELLADPYSVFPNVPLLLNRSDLKAPATNLRTAYAASWNATIESELGRSMVVGLSYLGSSGSHLYSNNNVNRFGSRGLLDASCVTTRFAADGVTALGPDYTDCPRLNSGVTSIAIRGNEGHSTFHALELKLDSRNIAPLGLVFGVSYTWSHSIDNASSSGGTDIVANSFVGPWPLSAFQSSLDRGPSDFDQRHRVVGHFIWKIPGGERVRNPLAAYAVQGWAVTGILSYQTGQPFTIVDSGVPDFTGGEHTRPRVTGSLPHRGRLVPDSQSPDTFLYLALNQVYDPDSGRCVAHTAPFACEISVNGPFDGILPRNIFRRPGTIYQDLAILKDFSLPKEGQRVQLRAEFYNFLNHPNLYINAGTGDINTQSFTAGAGTGVAGVTASFRDNRQIVLALKFLF